MKKEIFISMLIAQALNVRENATQQEKDNINLETLDFSTINNCLFKQMTGHYRNERTLILAPKVIAFNKTIVNDDFDINDYKRNHSWDGTQQFTEEVFTLLTTNNKKFLHINESILSPIEWYALLDNPNINDLVQYIKGETETFNPTWNA